jgi:hypothetical protein
VISEAVAERNSDDQGHLSPFVGFVLLSGPLLAANAILLGILSVTVHFSSQAMPSRSRSKS